MLIKLDKNDIVKYWDDIKETLYHALPPTAEGEENPNLSNILQLLLEDFMQAWVLLGKDSIYAVALTTIQKDLGTEQKSLLIYSLFGYKLIPGELWQDGLSTLRTYAKNTGCRYITGYTKVERIKEVVQKLQGDTSYSFIRMEV